ncbi:ABC transporter permease subunit [Bosea sp. OK403]|uniref:ABC transporter permease subunit n=1 Tax=Bosea sp. OK403 TaxID=1855286 RepID=UPI000AAA6EAE|nr:ABC transporter permease subunit [Bosea sp. OK403]
MQDIGAGAPWRPSRRFALKLAGVVALALFLAWLGHNVAENMAQRGMHFSFDFLHDPFGVDISFHILPWQLGQSHGYALLVALVNTLFTAAIAILLASALGLLLGLMRLSGNPLASGASYAGIECVRNVPLLTQIIFLYIGALQLLPPARASIVLGPDIYLNVRGLFVPVPEWGWSWAVWPVAALSVLALLRAQWRQRVPAALLAAALATLFFAFAASWNRPVLRGFGFSGGWLLTPELLAVWIGVSVYVSAFIAEIVRSTIGGVAKGQREAAASLGLKWHQEMFLVILPQALRAMIPPLTNQYLNVVKATTLGAAVAFPEVVQVFARSIMNQTGRSVEIMLMILTIYVGLNLILASLMNAWNRRLEIPGR